MKIAYVRVSTVEQNTDRQEIEADKYYEDKASGTNTNRPQLKEMLDNLRKGDEVICWSIDRLARSITDLHSIIKTITDKGASVSFIKENMTFTGDKTNPMNELMLNLLGSVYEFETAIRKERQLEGIAKAKAKGIYKGRTTSDRLKSNIIEAYKDGIPQRAIAEKLNTSLSNVQRVIKSFRSSCEGF
ncbi:recombinase family protein [uncultured Psychromonas sp.]|uniref:recombinase family protein n=1 Tax=uncultured Psychromonas sp. TaxID=173974 RepID=UPI00262FE427|nr:recombinase family protein [uncultured Psychromonas sp.]